MEYICCVKNVGQFIDTCVLNGNRIILMNSKNGGFKKNVGQFNLYSGRVCIYFLCIYCDVIPSCGTCIVLSVSL